jgi:chloramphenicol-sensitive protein RarD
LFPIYWRLIESAPAIEILANRIVWSLVFMVGLLVVQKDLMWWKTIRHNRRLILTYTVAALLLSANWFTYIWAVTNDRIVALAERLFVPERCAVVLLGDLRGRGLDSGVLAALA